MAGKARGGLDLGDITPPAALETATQEKDYYSVRVPKALIQAMRQAQARDGFKMGHEHFTKIATDYLREHHPDLL